MSDNTCTTVVLSPRQTGVPTGHGSKYEGVTCRKTEVDSSTVSHVVLGSPLIFSVTKDGDPTTPPTDRLTYEGGTDLFGS